MKEIDQKLAQLGLTPNEREVYFKILEGGKVAAARVSDLTGVNRTTVYSIAKKLSKLGLVTIDIGNKVRYFVAESPDNIKKMIAREETEINTKKAIAEQLATELAKLTNNTNYSIPHIKVVEEADLSDYLYKQYPQWGQSGMAIDNTWWGFHDHSFTETYGKWIDWSWKNGPEGVKVKFLTNDAKAEKEKSDKHAERQIRVWQNDQGFDVSLWIIGDYIIMVKSRERPHYLVEIHDKVLARNLRTLFQGVWQLTEINKILSPKR